MRSSAVLAIMLLSATAGAQTQVPAPTPPPALTVPPAPTLPPPTPPSILTEPASAPTPPATHGHTLGGHRFMYPSIVDSAFLQTMLGTRTSVRREWINDIPIGNFRVDVNALGVREVLEFELALGERWSVGLAAGGQFASGSSGRALATQGAFWSYGLLLNGAFRIARIESSGTQITVRAQVFGIQGGGRFSLIPILQSIRSNPRDIPDVLVNFGDLLVTPASWYGFAGSFDLAQAITPIFSLQASFRLDVRRFRQSPFVPSVGRRVDVDSTGWLPQVGVAFGVNPPDFPLSFLAEYRASAQDSNDPASFAHNVVGLGAYYSGRPNLQAGPIVYGEFGLPEVHGVDANGNPLGSDRGNALSGQFMMRYIW